MLAVGAHPDDLEISCAGTLAKLVAQGHEVVMAHASSGDKGHYRIPPRELSRIREQEARDAAAVIGCEAVTLGLTDGGVLEGDQEIRRRLADVIADVQPDFVITHSPTDYMPDHVAVSRLVFDCTFLATLPGFAASGKHADKVPALFYMDNLAGTGFEPTLYVDISDTVQRKIEMLRKHDSQLTWLKEHDHVDIIEFVETLSRLRGIQAGCSHAEGFVQHMVWARPNAIRFPV